MTDAELINAILDAAERFHLGGICVAVDAWRKAGKPRAGGTRRTCVGCFYAAACPSRPAEDGSCWTAPPDESTGAVP